MASGTIPLLEHRIQGTKDSGNKSGSFPCPTPLGNASNVTFFVIGWDEIYAVYCEPGNNLVRSKLLVTVGNSPSRNMAFTCSNGIVSWTSNSQLYSLPIILY